MARQAGETNNQASASARFVRISAYKVREVAALIRGKPVDEARRILAFTPKAAGRELAKVLESAVANAEQNFQIPQEELFVRGARADEGKTIPRSRPRAQGRAYRIRKRTCHISLLLERLQPEPRAAAPRLRRAETGADSRAGKAASAGRPAKRGASRRAGPAEEAGEEASRDEGEAE